MRELKNSGIEWIGNIPAEWSVCHFRNILNIYNGNSIKDDEKALYEDPTDAVPYIATKDIDATLQTIDYSNGMYVKRSDSSFKRAPAGSILLCIEGGSAGKKIAFTDREVCFINKLCCFTSPTAHNRFLYYYMLSPAFTEEFKSHISGLIGGVSVNEIKSFAVVLPSYGEQIQIARALDCVCADIDTVIASTKATIEEYKALKQAIITDAVTEGIHGDCEMVRTEYEWIGEMPSHWKAIKCKWLLDERKERSEDGSEEPLSMSQKFGLIPTKEMDVVPNMAASFVGAKLVHTGDLVFNKLKAHLGVFAVSDYDGLVSPDYAVYYPTGLADVKYLEYLFKTPQYIAEFRKKSTGVGAGLTRLYTGDLFSIYCSLPPLEEQRGIVDFLDSKCAKIDKLIADKTHLLEELEQYKKSVIYEYVTGKKEVQ